MIDVSGRSVRAGGTDRSRHATAGASSSQTREPRQLDERAPTPPKSKALAAAPARKNRRVPVPRIWPVTANDVYAILGGNAC